MRARTVLIAVIVVAAALLIVPGGMYVASMADNSKDSLGGFQMGLPDPPESVDIPLDQATEGLIVVEDSVREGLDKTVDAAGEGLVVIQESSEDILENTEPVTAPVEEFFDDIAESFP